MTLDTSRSSRDLIRSPVQARRGPGAHVHNGNEWLQVNFERETSVTKVATQGRYDADHRLTSYSLSYSVDGSHWAWYRLSDGDIKVREIGLTDKVYMQ